MNEDGIIYYNHTYEVRIFTMRIDLHTHTAYSYDAEKSPICQHVEAAMKKGINVLGFSEHADFFYKETLHESDFAPGMVDVKTYEKEIAPFRQGRIINVDLIARHKEIQQCRQQWGDKIILREGIELGQPNCAQQLTEQFLQKYSFDYIIGSVHHLKDDMDFYFYHYENVNENDFLNAYFDEIEHMIQYGKFHILGHIDYPLRVMKLPNNQPSLKEYMDRVDVILHMIIERGIALECNTKGLFGWQQMVGPELFILERYHELGGEYITIGSDSHAPKNIGYGVDLALERIRTTGFRYVTDYQQGCAIQHTI